MTQPTVMPPAACGPPDEIGLLAQLAFASRRAPSHDTQAVRHLAFLPPDALDMDLTDPAQRDFGDYELLEKIGQGGMGVVYRARQHSLDRDVALKLLAAGPWASSGFIQRFRREAQSAARLEHPNIVTVYEAGSQHDLHYFSMRLVRGETLATRLARDGPLPPRESARLLRMVAEALDYAHRLGVLHLDLKPGNVLIDESGEPLVADFGLARRLDQAFADEGEDVSGTPSYMSPEQATANAQAISRATDIYGLGGILYELLTGRPPFLAATPQATLERVVRDALQAPRTVVAGVPPDLDAICCKCLAKDPARRYGSAGALADDLRRFLEDRAVSARQPGAVERAARWMRREPRVAAALGAFMLALLIGLGVSTQQWRRAEASAETSRRLLWEGRRAAAMRLEQDGRGYDSLALLIDNLREAEAVGAHAEQAGDRRRAGLMLGQGATLIDRIAIDDANPFALELSPGGGRLAIAFNDLSVRWYDTATLRELGRVSLRDRGSSSGSDRLPALLRFAGEQRLLVTLSWYTNLPNPSDSDTWLVDLARSEVVEPPAEFADFSDAMFSADGRHALLRNRAGLVQRWQVDPWRPLSPLLRRGIERQPWYLGESQQVALRFAVGQERLEFFRLPDFEPIEVVPMPNAAGVSAWAATRDGATLAIGDFEGRVYLLDLATRRLRPLPNTRGREVVWLAFSEDDAWLASATYGGLVSAFDVATGDPVHADLMRHDFAPRRLALSRAQRLLVVAGEGPIALWRLSDTGPRAAPPHRIGAGPAPHALAAPYAVGWSLGSGLLASAGIDGQVRLWRLPLSPTLAARTARQRADRLDFDGTRLVDVAWNRVRLVDAGGRAQGSWRSYDQPPGFAELLDAGRGLLLTFGPQLRYEDAVTGRPRHAPIALPDTPQRLLASPDGRTVLLSFGTPADGGFFERLRLLDVERGRLLPAEALVPGPVRRYAFSRDGARLLAVGPREGSTTVFDRAALQRVAEYPHDPYEPVRWADFMPDGTLVLATRADDPRLGQDALRRWDPDKDEICGEALLPNVQPLGAIALGERAFVAGARHDVGVDAAGEVQAVPRLAHSEASAVLALDPTGRLLARAHRHQVQLLDAHTLQPFGRPLAVDLGALDTIVQLAFAPDGDRLVATSWLGHWLQWSTAADPRGTTQLAAFHAPLAAAQEDQRLLIAPTAEERRGLRANDPGPWPSPEVRPEPAIAHVNAAGDAIPARTRPLPPQLVDLGSHYHTGPEASRNFFFHVLPSLRPVPVGLQRMGGVDFDVRGIAQVHYWSEAVRSGTTARQLECVALDGQSTPALHLLMDVSLSEPVASETTLARLRLHYVDGSELELPLRAGRELPGYQGEDRGVRAVFAANPLMAWAGLEDHTLSAPRVPNPHPERPLRCLDLVADRPLALLGLTLETPPVIAPAVGSSSP